jgi:hypothetical protein
VFSNVDLGLYIQNEMYCVPTYKIIRIPNFANWNSSWMTFQQKNCKRKILA